MWQYFCSISKVLSKSENVTPYAGYLAVEGDKVIVPGTPPVWPKIPLVSHLIINANNQYRVRCFEEPQSYGVIIEIHKTLFEEGLESKVAFQGEDTLLEFLFQWNLFIFSRRMVLFPTEVRSNQLRPRLTAPQHQALQWMRNLEGRKGEVLHFKCGIPVSENWAFSITDCMFIRSEDMKNEEVKIRGAVLSGDRHAGKTLVVQHYLQTCKKTSEPMTSPSYYRKFQYSCSLFVVPTYLIQYWYQALKNVHGVSVEIWTSAERIHQFSPYGPTLVITNYKNLDALKSSRVSHSIRHAHIRKGVVPHDLDTIVWDRIFFDEPRHFQLDYFCTNFVWILQGNATCLQEIQYLNTLYAYSVSCYDLLSSLVFRLPSIVLKPREPPVTYTFLSASEFEKVWCASDLTLLTYGHHLRSIGVLPSWKDVQSSILNAKPEVTVLSNKATSDQRLSNFLNLVLASDVFANMVNELESEMEAEERENMEAEERENMEAQDGSESEVASRLENESEADSRFDNGATWSEVDSDLESKFEEEGEITKSFELFLAKELESLEKEPAQCSICMERECNVISVCGHSFCMQCSNNLLKRSCPQCRRKFGGTCPTFYHARPDFTPILHSFMQDELAVSGGKSALLVGKSSSALRFLSHLLPPEVHVLHEDELLGQYLTNLSKIYLLEGCSIPLGQQLVDGGEIIKISVV